MFFSHSKNIIVKPGQIVFNFSRYFTLPASALRLPSTEKLKFRRKTDLYENHLYQNF